MTQLLDWLHWREKYNYDADFNFTINDISYTGIHCDTHPNPRRDIVLTMRDLEVVMRQTLDDANIFFMKNGNLDDDHLTNFCKVIGVVIYWKLASQGGRAENKRNAFLNQCNENSAIMMLQILYYARNDVERMQDLCKFPSVGTAVASAILRFFNPYNYGCVDRFAAEFTNEHGITHFNLRTDGWVSEASNNLRHYVNSYLPFLRKMARELNERGDLYQEYEPQTQNLQRYSWRPCDIEMAIFEMKKQCK